MTGAKRIAVVVASERAERVREALRAAVGLSLRGDRVLVQLPTRWLEAGDPAIDRAVATLTALGHTIDDGDAGDAGACDAVEVWT